MNRSIAPPPFGSAPVGDEVVMQRRPNLKLVLMSATLQKDMGRMTDPNGIWRAPEKWIRSNAHLNAPTVFRQGGFWAMFPVKGGENWFNITPTWKWRKAALLLHDPNRYPRQWGWRQRITRTFSWSSLISQTLRWFKFLDACSRWRLNIFHRRTEFPQPLLPVIWFNVNGGFNGSYGGRNARAFRWLKRWVLFGKTGWPWLTMADWPHS